jgi:hypothetical protein
VKRQTITWIASTWKKTKEVVVIYRAVTALAKQELDKLYDIAGYLLGRLHKYLMRKKIGASDDMLFCQLFVRSCSYQANEDTDKTAYEVAKDDNMPVDYVFESMEFDSKMFAKDNMLQFVNAINDAFSSHMTFEFIISQCHEDPSLDVLNIILAEKHIIEKFLDCVIETCRSLVNHDNEEKVCELAELIREKAENIMRQTSSFGETLDILSEVFRFIVEGYLNMSIKDRYKHWIVANAPFASAPTRNLLATLDTDKTNEQKEQKKYERNNRKQEKNRT